MKTRKKYRITDPVTPLRDAWLAGEITLNEYKRELQYLYAPLLSMDDFEEEDYSI